MNPEMTSYSLSLKVQKGDLTFKNRYIRSDFPGLGEASLNKVGRIPALLAPIVEKTFALPFEQYNLELHSILSLAIVMYPNGHARYLIPLDPTLEPNHPDPIFSTSDFTACVLDEKTIITFRE